MRIGIFGTGGMADALGTHWARAGHEIRVAGRKTGTWREVAAFADVVLLAIPSSAIGEVLAQAGPLTGKVLVDCTNDPALTGTPVASRIVTEAHVVKAFNLAHVDIWRMNPPVFDGRPLSVPLCGDDPAALETVSTLVRDIGARPVRAGGLSRAALLEATAAFAIGLWFAGEDAQAILAPLG
ncbi:NADPH-dependent F420 reductase [Amycolatopsis vancoresmycina]|uniref:NADP oxidoreductase coenzyme F420-dependent protein n=1 Tax=Amycolatopsis vancoresmycina DSM 44592 TaxID=1292037 RepID=R1I0E1_9PSEU|nr:NAD(P)-binding domain-containing protein [Amycolatopsis vancoresmycina]EOD69295.1 NADP oxidoreductase coenzyme F420-dependent protein [Amycolatopsis vancoresmycina DSM 44592]